MEHAGCLGWGLGGGGGCMPHVCGEERGVPQQKENGEEGAACLVFRDGSLAETKPVKDTDRQTDRRRRTD